MLKIIETAETSTDAKTRSESRRFYTLLQSEETKNLYLFAFENKCEIAGGELWQSFNYYIAWEKCEYIYNPNPSINPIHWAKHMLLNCKLYGMRKYCREVEWQKFVVNIPAHEMRELKKLPKYVPFFKRDKKTRVRNENDF